MINPTDKLFFDACDAMTEALRRVRECSMPCIEDRVAEVIFLCDPLKSSSMAYATRGAYMAAKKEIIHWKNAAKKKSALAKLVGAKA